MEQGGWPSESRQAHHIHCLPLHDCHHLRPGQAVDADGAGASEPPAVVLEPDRLDVCLVFVCHAALEAAREEVQLGEQSQHPQQQP